MAKIFSHIKSTPYKFRHITFAIILWFVLMPFLEGGGFRLVLLNCLTSLIVLSGIIAVSEKRKTVIIGVSLGTPWFILSWIEILTAPLPLILSLISNSFLILFLIFTAFIILKFILESKEVSGDILYGAISTYFIIGGFWSMIYAVLETVQPGSFIISSTHNLDGAVNWSNFVYYSYTTLTTLGYGDVVPVTSLARSFAVLEAIMGVMYLAIIISRLVGLFIARSTMKE